jgi:hypothetical protein
VLWRANPDRFYLLYLKNAKVLLGPLDVFPPDAFFGFVRPGENVKRTVSLSRRDGNPFEIKGVRAPRGILVAVCHTASSSKHDVTLTLAPNIAPGILKGNLELHTTVRAAETLRLPLYVHVLPRG